jgi:hypothetical protein
VTSNGSPDPAVDGRQGSLVDRLRGLYPVGPDGVYGVRSFADFIPPISFEAADRIAQLESELAEAVLDILAYEKKDPQRWIPVDEKLPDGFLCLVPGGVARYAGKGVWITATDTEYPGREIQWEVTHWMRLPDPPGEAQ